MYKVDAKYFHVGNDQAHSARNPKDPSPTPGYLRNHLIFFYIYNKCLLFPETGRRGRGDGMAGALVAKIGK